MQLLLFEKKKWHVGFCVAKLSRRKKMMMFIHFCEDCSYSPYWQNWNIHICHGNWRKRNKKMHINHKKWLVTNHHFLFWERDHYHHQQQQPLSWRKKDEMLRLLILRLLLFDIISMATLALITQTLCSSSPVVCSPLIILRIAIQIRNRAPISKQQQVPTNSSRLWNNNKIHHAR